MNDATDSDQLKALKSVFIEIRTTFLGRLPAALEEIRSAVKENDMARARSICHELKGTAGTCGFDDISETVRKIEQLTRTSETASVEALLATAKSACEAADANQVTMELIQSYLS